MASVFLWILQQSCQASAFVNGKKRGINLFYQWANGVMSYKEVMSFIILWATSIWCLRVFISEKLTISRIVYLRRPSAIFFVRNKK